MVILTRTFFSRQPITISFAQPPKDKHGDVIDNDRLIFLPERTIDTISEANRQREQIRRIIKNCDDSRLLQMMGYLNYLIYNLAQNKRFEAIARQKVDDVESYVINHDNLQNMLAIADAGVLDGTFATTGASDYLRKHWPGAYCGRISIIAVREVLSRYLSLFDYTPGKVKTRATPVLSQINYKRMLIAYEAMEDELASRHPDGQHYELLPEHLGANVVRIYNAVFMGFMKYRRPKWRNDFGFALAEERIRHKSKWIIESLGVAIASIPPLVDVCKQWWQIAAEGRRRKPKAYNSQTGKWESYISCVA